MAYVPDDHSLFYVTTGMCSCDLYQAWMGVLIPPILAVFGIGLFKFGKYLSKDEPGFLKDFLINLLDAKEIDSVEPSHSQGHS